MSSSIILVSLCVIRIEIIDEDCQENAELMAAKKMRGRRKPTEIRVETYSRSGETPSPLLSSSESSPSTSFDSDASYSSYRSNATQRSVKASSFHATSTVPVYYAPGSLPIYQPSSQMSICTNLNGSLYQPFTVYQPPRCANAMYGGYSVYQMPVCNTYEVCATVCQVQCNNSGFQRNCGYQTPVCTLGCQERGYDCPDETLLECETSEDCLQFKFEVDEGDDREHAVAKISCDEAPSEVTLQNDNLEVSTDQNNQSATEAESSDNPEQESKEQVSEDSKDSNIDETSSTSPPQIPASSSSDRNSEVRESELPGDEPLCSESSLAQSSSSKATEESSEEHFSTDRSTVEVCKGILHLFKENELTEMQVAANRTNTVCILSVPSTMTCKDLLRFMGPFHPEIQHVRILRDNSPNHYLALITFRSSRSARAFYEAFNGTSFTSLEPEVICNMVFVARVELSNHGRPIPGHTELPTCPVCLERMDESVDGVLTTLCSHSFHSACIAKCKDDICPVCRNAQVPERWADSHCVECVVEAPNEDLWICLICGHIGCSRYQQGHAFQHYHDTYHCYAMQLSTNRVWDYVGDNFVHRLMQNKDGKMVEGAQGPGKQEDSALEEKMEAIQLEFTHLLTSQLEVQRKYFEDKLGKLEARASQETGMLKEKLEEVEKENAKIKEDLEALKKEKQSAEKRFQAANKKLTQTQDKLHDEEALRKALETNQMTWKEKCDKLEKDLEEYKTKKEAELMNLNEQLKDIMLYLDARQIIEESTKGEGIDRCDIVTPNLPGPSGTRSQKSKRRR